MKAKGLDQLMSQVSQPTLAKHLGITQQGVSHHVRRGYFPIHLAIEIEKEYDIWSMDLIYPKLRDYFEQYGVAKKEVEYVD